MEVGAQSKRCEDILSTSLGAAILASIALQREYGISNKCVAFAPPPVVNKSAAEGTEDFILSVVHGDDIIPRWNLGIVATA